MIDGIDFLQLLWFPLIGLLFMILYFTEGFGYGVGMATKFLVGDDREKRLMIETTESHWDGNEIRLIIAGGAMFTLFSDRYASLFSGYCILLLSTLFALVVRGVSFEFSAHAEIEHGFRIWTGALSWGSLLAPFFLTMMFGSLAQDVSIDVQGNMSLSLWSIANPLSIVAGVASILLCLVHGINFLRLGVDDPESSERAASLNEKLYLIAYLGEVVFALLVFFQADLSKLRSVSSAIATLIIVALAAQSDTSLIKSKQVAAFVIGGLISTAAVGFLLSGPLPRVLIAADSVHSLLIKTAANSKPTLEIMTVIALILSSITLVYIIWSYAISRRRTKVNQNA